MPPFILKISETLPGVTPEYCVFARPRINRLLLLPEGLTIILYSSISAISKDQSKRAEGRISADIRALQKHSGRSCAESLARFRNIRPETPLWSQRFSFLPGRLHTEPCPSRPSSPVPPQRHLRPLFARAVIERGSSPNLPARSTLFHP